MNIHKKIVYDFVANDIEFVTTVPCKQLAGVIDLVEAREEIFHIPSNKEDEGMGLCAGAFMGHLFERFLTKRCCLIRITWYT